jgi:hypothetical protein
MSFLKGLADKVARTKAAIEEEASRRAAKKATELALDAGKAAATQMVKNAGKTLNFVGKRMENALFGEDASEAPPAVDPFAKLKAQEASQSRGERTTPKAAVRDTEREVDAELEAMKKRLRGG